jgi:hypothetical protein
MIIYHDLTIELAYTPAQDVLSATLQTERVYETAEVRKAFISIVAYIKEYKVSRLLLDFRRNTLDLSETDYKTTVAQLTVGLMHTPLQKVARVGTADPVREQKIETTYGHIKDAVAVPIQVRMFSDKTEALEWLTTVH